MMNMITWVVIKSLSKSENPYIFGDGKPSPSLGKAKIEFLDHEFNIDVVSRDVPDLIGMDILGSKDILQQNV